MNDRESLSSFVSLSITVFFDMSDFNITMYTYTRWRIASKTYRVCIQIGSDNDVNDFFITARVLWWFIILKLVYSKILEKNYIEKWRVI